MFKTRLLTALVLLPLLLLALFKLSPMHLNYLMLLAIVEWGNMLKLAKISTLIICALFAGFAIKFPFESLNYLLILKLAVLFWTVSFILLLQFPKLSNIWRLPKLQVLYVVPLFLPAYIAFSYVNMTLGLQGLIFALALIFSADSGAYAFGKLFGSAKMAPNISPGKTIAGLYGAILSGILVSLLFSAFTQNTNYAWLICLGVITVLFSINGDLAQSALKRVHGVKDSGNLIPGHGGVFDRLDSIIGALPIFALMCNYLLQTKIIHYVG
jgi:phosphatidate cytidylyltransferase